MKSFGTAVNVAVTALLLAFPVGAEEVVKVEGETFINPAKVLEAVPASLHLDPAGFPVLESRGTSSPATLVLPGLDIAEIKRLQQATGGNEKSLRVGIDRSIAASFGDAADWNWVAVDGGKVVHLGVASTGAVRIRAQLQLGELPAGVELRFFSPAEPAAISGVFTRADMDSQPKDSVGNTLFWSPSVAGDTLRLEVFLPEGVQPSDLRLDIPQLSHVVLDPVSGNVQQGILEANTAACFIDAACLTPDWQRMGRSVGGYFFNDDKGYVGFCSGALVNTTVGNGIPYFLTANHCIDSTMEAASMDLVWQYVNSACGSNDAKTRVLFTSGAKLLATNAEVDTTLVQLNDYPPGVSYFTGWVTSALTSQVQVGGIHHAGIENGITPRAYAQGHFLEFWDVKDNQPILNSAGKFAAVQWTHGVTAPGSSGSGLWAVQEDGYYLKGLLSSGASSCSNPSGVDFYSRLDLAYPMLQPWLNPAR